MKQPRLCSQHQTTWKLEDVKQVLGNLQPVCVFDVSDAEDVGAGDAGSLRDAVVYTEDDGLNSLSAVYVSAGNFRNALGPTNDAPTEQIAFDYTNLITPDEAELQPKKGGKKTTKAGVWKRLEGASAAVGDAVGGLAKWATSGMKSPWNGNGGLASRPSSETRTIKPDRRSGAASSGFLEFQRRGTEMSWNSVWTKRFRVLWNGDSDTVNMRVLANVLDPASQVTSFDAFNYLLRAMVMKDVDAGLKDNKDVQRAFSKTRPHLFTDESAESREDPSLHAKNKAHSDRLLKHLRYQYDVYDQWIVQGGAPKSHALLWFGLIPKWSMPVLTPVQRRGRDGSSLFANVRSTLPLSPPLSKHERDAATDLDPFIEEFASKGQAKTDGGARDVLDLDEDDENDASFLDNLKYSVFGRREIYSMNCYSVRWPMKYVAVVSASHAKTFAAPATASRPTGAPPAPVVFTYKLEPTEDAQLLSGVRMYFPKNCDTFSQVLRQKFEEAVPELEAKQAVLDQCQPKAYVTPVRAIDESGFLRGNGPSGSTGDLMQMAFLFANAYTQEELSIMRLHLVSYFTFNGMHSFIEVLLGSEVEFRTRGRYDKEKNNYQMRSILEKLQKKDSPVTKIIETLTGTAEARQQMHASLASLWEYFHRSSETSRIPRGAGTAGGTDVMNTLAEELPQPQRTIHRQLMALAGYIARGFEPDLRSFDAGSRGPPPTPKTSKWTRPATPAEEAEVEPRVEDTHGVEAPAGTPAGGSEPTHGVIPATDDGADSAGGSSAVVDDTPPGGAPGHESRSDISTDGG
ncbi:unnamed protein product, partial [Amoebophrya sp. A25]|eukprot:GSA25T00004024001.1